MKLIDKDALLAEIEKLKKDAELYLKHNSDDDPLYEIYKYQKATMLDLLNKVDTLEVKEVDLEKYYHDFLQKEWFENSHVRTISEMMAFTAKHFFELGMAVSIKE